MLELTDLNSNNNSFKQSEDLSFANQQYIIGGSFGSAFGPAGTVVGGTVGAVGGATYGYYVARKAGLPPSGRAGAAAGTGYLAGRVGAALSD